jgi:hypothetical protein
MKTCPTIRGGVPSAGRGAPSTCRTSHWVLIALVALAATATAAEVELYILTGQSNMLGTTAADDPQPAPGKDPADATARMLWSNVSPANAGWPPRLLGDSGGRFVPLAVQQGDGGKNATFWGPEFGFARELAARGRGPAVIVKACRGGGSNALWDKATFDREQGAGHMWGHVRDTLDAALAALADEADAAVRIRGFCYLQGESNSVADAAVAGERLAALVKNLTAHVEERRPGATRGMRVAVAEIAASRANPRRVQTTAAQQAFCRRFGNAAFVATADLPLKSDGIHFGGAEKLEIGRRLAAAVAGPERREPRSR